MPARSPPRGAIDLCRAAIAAHEPEVGALVHLDASATADRTTGPLAGVAVGVKDIVDVAGMPTRMGSPLYADNVPRADAAIVTAARRAGAVPLAKTTTTPFAYLDPTATRNPRAPGCTPGGSSSGSAACVAAGHAAARQFGHPDRPGSVIRPPAAFLPAYAAVKPLRPPPCPQGGR